MHSDGGTVGGVGGLCMYFMAHCSVVILSAIAVELGVFRERQLLRRGELLKIGRPTVQSRFGDGNPDER